MQNNLLLSFPRSGNTWIRYILEYISRRPTSMGTVQDCQEGINKTDTIGISGVDITQKCIVIKRHRADSPWDNWQPENTKLILLVRDYQEACLRHLTPDQKQSTEEIKHCAEGYVHCLKFYDEFKGNKLLIYYEDIIYFPKQTINKIIEFLDIEKNLHYHEFWKNYNEHKEKSIQGYTPGSATLGLKSNSGFHSKRAHIRIKKLIDRIIKQDQLLFNKYLKRYHG